MKVISEISLRDFKFWSGGEDRAKNCTDEQLDKIESIMESDAPESGWTDDDINNFFWFDFDTIADWLGYKDEKHFDAGVSEDDVKEVIGRFPEGSFKVFPRFGGCEILKQKAKKEA